MARKPRSDTRNSIFHVFTKGNNRCNLFHVQKDYQKFIHLLKDSRAKDPHTLLAFCLMPNHIHLLLETSAVPLSKVMHRLLLRYSLYFNRRNNRVGHLFQNRFKAKPCKQENYLLQLLVYIHDNPRKAGLVTNGVIYPYSSERVYSQRVAVSAPVDNFRALTLIGPSPKTALKAYRYHLSYTRRDQSEPSDPSIKESSSADPFFPDQSVYLDTGPSFSENQVERQFEFLRSVPLEHLCAAAAKIMDVDMGSIPGPGRGRKVSAAKAVIIYAAQKAGWRNTDLRNELGFNPGSIAYHTGRLDKEFNLQEKERILKRLQMALTEIYIDSA